MVEFRSSTHLLVIRSTCLLVERLRKKVHGGTQICTEWPVFGPRVQHQTRTREVRAELGRRIQLTLLLRECANCEISSHASTNRDWARMSAN